MEGSSNGRRIRRRYPGLTERVVERAEHAAIQRAEREAFLARLASLPLDHERGSSERSGKVQRNKPEGA